MKTHHIFRLFVAIALFSQLFITRNASSAATWVVSLDSPYGQVKTMAVFNGKLYAGAFTGQSDAHLYVYDGSNWSDLQMATSIGVALDMIESMQVYDGSLFIGVRTHVDTTYNSRVYRYDGTAFNLDFSTAGTPNQSGIEDLVIHDGLLYAAQAMSNGAVYQRNSEGNWVPLGGNLTNQESVRSLASYNGDLYRGTGYSQGKVQRWTGTSWEQLVNVPVQFGINANAVWSMAASTDALFAGPVGVGSSTCIPVFDGVNWSAGQSYPGNFVRLKAIGNQVWAGISNGKVYWNNGTWQEYTALPVFAYDFAEFGGMMYAAGSNGTIYRAGAPVDAKITGQVTDAYGDPVSGVTMTITGGSTATTNSEGAYTFTGLAAGSYTVTPSMSGRTFYPASRVVEISQADSTGNDFVALPVPKSVDLTISLYRQTVSPEEKAAYESILEYFADAVFEMSNGAHQIRNVTIYLNGENYSTADIIWIAHQHPASTVAGRGVSGKYVYFGDIFWFENIVRKIDKYNALDFANHRGAGYTLAHEWGHYYYGLYDEYRADTIEKENESDPSSPHYEDNAVQNSIMAHQWSALSNNYAWLNFSVVPDASPGMKQTAQDRMYGASGWDTLIRTTDPPFPKAVLYTEAFLKRTHYPELVNVSPAVGKYPSKELDSISRPYIHTKLAFDWRESGEEGLTEKESTVYQSFVHSISGMAINYPSPLVVTAQVNNIIPLTNVDVIATYTSPDTTPGSLNLLDDGQPPDQISNDGVYSGILPYAQNGDYTIDVAFNNNSGEALLTQLSAAHSIGPNGETWVPEFFPVTEPFTASGSLTVNVSGVVADDHGDLPAAATALLADNNSVWGRMDRSGDVDVFRVTPGADGEVSVRLTSLGLEMQPHVEIIAADGVTSLGVYDFEPNPVTYFNVQFTAAMGVPIYVAVSHRENAAMGIYMISAGEKIDSDRQVSTIFLPMIR